MIGADLNEHVVEGNKGDEEVLGSYGVKKGEKCSRKDDGNSCGEHVQQ